ncbi:hypothetical protein PYW08_012331 [Mythimna loreyi]|uniref:Uncharacterized protein n=1 Tax=Mythimna loreyi TaxID=667449 RepID=A0ACC2Q044_9NEOP|nr:hypothetical protein PYW08_012331 [Mythimna loreyi]
MEKLPMCRICLVKNVRMYIVVGKHMQDLYELLTDVPFITEDTRPALACYFCYAKLKQCCRLQQQCREAEELFAEMMNEPNPSINRGQLEWFNGYVKTPVEIISTENFDQMEHVAIKEEPEIFEELEDIVEPKVEQQSDNNGYSDVEETPPQHYEYDLDVTEFKTEVEEQEVLEKKHEATDMEWTSAAKKSKEDTHRIQQEDEVPVKHIRTHTARLISTTKYTAQQTSSSLQEI